MSKKKFLALILIEILTILLFKTIEYSGFSIPTYDISKLSILLGIIIFVLGLFLIAHLTAYIYKRIEDHYIYHLSPVDRDFYDLLCTELDARELSTDLNGQISSDMLKLLYKNSKASKNFDHSSPRYFKNRCCNTYEDHGCQRLLEQLIHTYSKKTKLISNLNILFFILIFFIAFNFALNGYNFNANYFRISLPFPILFLGLINYLPHMPSKYFSHAKHWKKIQFGITSVLDIGALILLTRWQYANPSDHAILNFIAHGKIEFIPNLYVLLAIVILIIISYITPRIIRRHLLSSVFTDPNLEYKYQNN